MDIVKIDGYTRILGAPADWDSETMGPCEGLPIVDRPDGWMVSQWKPSAEELAALNSNSSLFMWVYGTSHPVVGLSVVDHAGGTAGSNAPSIDRIAQLEEHNRWLRQTLATLSDTMRRQAGVCDIALDATK